MITKDQYGRTEVAMGTGDVIITSGVIERVVDVDGDYQLKESNVILFTQTIEGEELEIGFNSIIANEKYNDDYTLNNFQAMLSFSNEKSINVLIRQLLDLKKIMRGECVNE